MAIKISGNTIIDNSRNIVDAGSVDATAYSVNNTEIVDTNLQLKNIASIDTTTNASIATAIGLDQYVRPTVVDRSWLNNESLIIDLYSGVEAAQVIVEKEVPSETSVTNSFWTLAANGLNYEHLDMSYDTTLTYITNPGTFGDASGYTGTSIAPASDAYNGGFGLAFSADGTKLFHIGWDLDQNKWVVFSYTLSTAFDLSTAVYDDVTLDTSGEEWFPRALVFSIDGTKMFLASASGNKVHSYTLTTAYDISTASYDNVFFDVSNETSNIKDFKFSSDGTKMILTGNDSSQVLYSYTLTTAYDISTASYDNVSVNVSNDVSSTNVWSIDFSADGTRLYLLLQSNSTYMYYTGYYTLTTPFDISTAVFDSNQRLDIETSSAQTIVVGDNDSKLFFMGGYPSRLYEYWLGEYTPTLQLGTGTFSADDIGKKVVVGNGEAIITAADGSYEFTTAPKLDYKLSVTSDEWQLLGTQLEGGKITTTGNIFRKYDLSDAPYQHSFEQPELRQTTGLLFNNDGTKMFTIGWYPNKSVYSYTLSTAFDLSTATYDNVSFSFGNDSSYGFSFNNDGTKMFVVTGGTGGSTVKSYTLTTGFDISTASYDNVIVVVSSDGIYNPYGINFNTNGTKMLILENENFGTKAVHSYTLTTAYDISTASYDNVSIDISGQNSKPTDMTFSDDGTKMFIIDAISKLVHLYTLTTAYDISTASYDNLSFDTTEQVSGYTELGGIAFDNVGDKMFIAESSWGQPSIHSYSTGITLLEHPNKPQVAFTKTIETDYWKDLNSVDTTSTDGDGEVFYAYSVDGRQTWNAQKSYQVRPLVRNDNGIWQVNDDIASTFTAVNWVNATSNTSEKALQEAFSLEAAPAPYESFFAFSLENSSNVLSDVGLDARNFALKDDGTKLFAFSANSKKVTSFSLSTAFDVSTATYDNVFFDVSNESSVPMAVFVRPDGTQLFVSSIGATGVVGNEVAIYVYDMSTPWDLSTASYSSTKLDLSAHLSFPYRLSFFFKPDGTQLFVPRGYGVQTWNLGTAWDMSTATFDFDWANPNPLNLINVSSIFFTSDGSRLLLFDNQKGGQIPLTTPWDLSTADASAATTVYISDIGASDSQAWGAVFTDNGNQMIIGINDGWTNSRIESFRLSDKWSYNRSMTSSEFDLLGDSDLPALGNDLDIGIGLLLDAKDDQDNFVAKTKPTYSGTVLNYETNARNVPAVYGTDYEYHHPEPDKVEFTALTDENFKIRIL